MRIVFIIVILIELKSVIDNEDPSLEWIRGSLSAAMIPDHPRRRARLTFSRGHSVTQLLVFQLARSSV